MLVLLGIFAAPETGSIAASIAAVMSRWAFLFVGAGAVLAAFLVNRFARDKKRHVRRVTIMYGLYLLTAVLGYGLAKIGASEWAARALVASELLQAFTVINVAGLIVFDVILPKAGIDLVSITSDILIGLAYIVTTIGVLGSAGLNLTSVVTASALVGVVVTVSMQTTLGNILGGVALQLDGSIQVGDWIALDNGKQGKVKEIRWRHTVVETRDWDTIIVPNSALLGSNITILGKREGEPLQHRMWVYFNVDFRHSPARVVSCVEEALRAAPIEGVASSPPPNCICMDFSRDGRDSYAYYAVRYWLTDLAADDPTSSRVRARVYAALRRARIPLARPVRTLFFKPEEDEAARHRRHAEERLSALRHLELFRTLTEEELREIAGRLNYAPFTSGEIVTRKGAIAHWLYILTSGRVEVMAIAHHGPSRVVASLEAPNFFGEMGLMAGEPRSADVVARSEVECYRLDKTGLEKVLQARPEIAQAMSGILAHRRVELDAIREGLDAESQRRREAVEQEKILSRIQEFFGLEN